MPLQQGGILLENNNQLQLSSIKGGVLVSDINLASNRANWVEDQVPWHSDIQNNGISQCFEQDNAITEHNAANLGSTLSTEGKNIKALTFASPT